jgi:hypothetical protein
MSAEGETEGPATRESCETDDGPGDTRERNKEVEA